MANGDEETSRPRTITASTVWEAFDRFASDMGARFDRFTSENREARHSSANQITAVIGAESRETRELIGALEARVRALETSTPSSLGQRMGDSEKWMAVMGSANLPDRVDRIESTLDKFGGSLTFLKVVGVGLGVLNGIVIFWATVMGARPVP